MSGTTKDHAAVQPCPFADKHKCLAELSARHAKAAQAVKQKFHSCVIVISVLKPDGTPLEAHVVAHTPGVINKIANHHKKPISITFQTKEPAVTVSYWARALVKGFIESKPVEVTIHEGKNPVTIVLQKVKPTVQITSIRDFVRPHEALRLKALGAPPGGAYSWQTDKGKLLSGGSDSAKPLAKGQVLFLRFDDSDAGNSVEKTANVTVDYLFGESTATATKPFTEETTCTAAAQLHKASWKNLVAVVLGENSFIYIGRSPFVPKGSPAVGGMIDRAAVLDESKAMVSAIRNKSASWNETIDELIKPAVYRGFKAGLTKLEEASGRGKTSSECDAVTLAVEAVNAVMEGVSTLPPDFIYWKAAYQHIWKDGEVQIANTVFGPNNPT